MEGFLRYKLSSINYKMDFISKHLLLRPHGLSITTNPLSPITYIIPLLDTSGSMNNDIDPIKTGMANFREIAKQNIFNNSETETAKYFKNTINYTSERYLDVIQQEYGLSVNEPKKYIFLIFQNESTPYRDAITAPNSTFNSDLNSLKSKFNTYSSVVTIIFQIAGYPDFGTHVENAVTGLQGYNDPLSQYNFYYQLNWNSSSSGQTYYDILINAVNSYYFVPLNYIFSP